MTKFIKPPLGSTELDDLEVPKGSNALQPTMMWGERSHYKNNIFIQRGSSPQNYDFWYKEPLYGRIDQKENAVYPEEGKFKAITSVSKQGAGLYALNFVVDAFEGLRRYLIKSSMSPQKTGMVVQGTLFTNIVAHRAWEDLHDKYHRWTEITYEWFKAYLNTSRRSKFDPSGNLANLNINSFHNFEGFLKAFHQFARDYAPKVPLTRTAYVLSRFASPRISGLIIEIGDDTPADDLVKYRRWIKDPNFEYYVKAAQRYGFYVDKNCPWRLIANLNNPGMKIYMERYNINLDNLFGTCYYRTELYDIEVLRQYLTAMYQSFIGSTSHQHLTKVDINTGETIRYVQERSTAEGDDPGFVYWMKLYFYIRKMERFGVIDDVAFEHDMKMVLNYYKHLGYTDAMKQIRKILGPLPRLNFDPWATPTTPELSDLVEASPSSPKPSY